MYKKVLFYIQIRRDSFFQSTKETTLPSNSTNFFQHFFHPIPLTNEWPARQRTCAGEGFKENFNEKKEEMKN